MPPPVPLASRLPSIPHPLPHIAFKLLDEEELVDKYPGLSAPILSKDSAMETTGPNTMIAIVIELGEVQSYYGGNVTVD